MNIYQLLATVACCLFLYLAVKAVNERYAVFVSIGGAVIILYFIYSKLSPVFLFMQELADRSGVQNQYFETVIKGLAVCYLGETTISFCKDCGQPGWSDKVELACRCTLLVLAIPLCKEFLDVILGLLE